MEKIPQNQTDVPVAEAKAEELKLEWGLELGRMSWIDAQKEITKLNKKLEKGEKLWRLPTKDELLAEFERTDSVDFKHSHYWSSSDDSLYGYSNDNAWNIRMSDGDAHYESKEFSEGLVRCVR